MAETLLPVGLAFIMFAIGLGLTVDDFRRILRDPRGLGLGVANQLVLLPLIGAALVLAFPGRPEFALGIMVLAACPGGITSNLLTLLAGGNTALSVSMTAISSLAGILTIPLVLGLSQQLLLGGETAAIQLPMERIIASVVVVTALPMLLGMGLNHRWGTLARRLRPLTRHLSTGIFALIVVGAFWSQRHTMVTHFAEVGPYVGALNVGTMALGLISARLLSLGRADGVAISMECGLQNAALAIFIAISVLGLPAVMVPAIIYALIMNVSAAGLIAWSRAKGLRPASQ